MTVSGYLQSENVGAEIENFFIFFVARETGKIRLQSLIRPTVIKISAPLTTATPKHKTEKTPSPLMPSMTTGKDIFYAIPKPFPCLCFLGVSSCDANVSVYEAIYTFIKFHLVFVLFSLIFFFFCLSCHLDLYFCLFSSLFITPQNVHRIQQSYQQ